MACCLPGWCCKFQRRIEACGVILYEESHLADGDFSTVTLVWHEDDLVVLKRTPLPADQKARADDVVTAHERLRGHPFIVHLFGHDLIAAGDALEQRLLLEYCAGGSLAASPLPIGEAHALPILGQLCSAVSACHAAGVTHRDVRLENVYRRAGPRDTYVLASFGACRVSKLPSSPSGQVLRSREAVAAARQEAEETVHAVCLAPEQVAPELGATLGPKVDVWGVGVVLHQLLLGVAPFASPLDTLADRAPLPAEASRSPAARKLMSKMLQRDPSARISAAEAETLVSALAYWPEMAAAAGAQSGVEPPIVAEVAPGARRDEVPPALLTQASQLSNFVDSGSRDMSREVSRDVSREVSREASQRDECSSNEVELRTAPSPPPRLRPVLDTIDSPRAVAPSSPSKAATAAAPRRTASPLPEEDVAELKRAFSSPTFTRPRWEDEDDDNA